VGYLSQVNGQSAASTTVTITDIEVPATANYAVFFVSMRGSNGAQTNLQSVTLGGAGFTYDSDTMRAFDGTFGATAAGWMPAADLPSGTVTAVATRESSIHDMTLCIAFFEDMAQQAPEAIALNQAAAASISTNITTLTDGAIVIDGVGHDLPAGNTLAVGAGQTEIYRSSDNATNYQGAVSYKEVATAGATTMGWTLSSADRFSHVVFALAPASGSASVGLLTQMLHYYS
jgi:hypothetical protein